MSRSLAKPNFPIPPSEYDQRYMAEVVRQFSLFLAQTSNPGDARHSSLTLTNLQTDDFELQTGSVYNHENYLMVTSLNRSSLRGSSMTSVIGSVTVSIS